VRSFVILPFKSPLSEGELKGGFIFLCENRLFLDVVIQEELVRMRSEP